MNNETPIMHRCMVALSEAGCLIWRNNTGSAWQGKKIHSQPGILTLQNPRLINFGLCVGSADLIGIKPTVITQDMVGKTIGVFIAPEIKQLKGAQSEDQKRFINAVITAGGIAGVARSEGEAVALLSGR